MIKFKKSLLLFILIILLALALSVTAEEEAEAYDFENSIITSNLYIYSSINIIPEKENHKVSELNAILKLKPYESFQQLIISSDIPSNGKESADSMAFTWKDTKEKELDFYIKAKIRTSNQIKQITKKIDFPLDQDDIQKEVHMYLQPTQTIKSDNKLIIQKASEIIEGEDDLYIVSVKIADWIKDNINYDLDTLTAEGTQDALWVLKNKRGVCDELTTLFLSMLRSLNIPAKYSYGVAYSNLPQYEDFVSHAWAEVYFPEYGWVPFDVTYGQFGYIDPSHIKLGDSVNTNKSSVSYSWLSYGLDIETTKLNIETDIENIEENHLNLFYMDALPEKENIGPDSYNLVRVNIKNRKKYYVATELLISRPKELEVDNDRKTVILKPYEQKTIGFVMKTPKTIKARTIYKYPITVITTSGSSSSTYFESTEDDPVFTKSKIQEIVDEFEEEKQKTYSTNVELLCELEKDKFYNDQTAKASCKIKNIGNTILKNLNLCLEKDCKTFDLGITQEHTEEFILNNENKKPGNKELTITLRNNDVFKKQDIKYILLDKPQLEITNIEHPTTANIDDVFNIGVSVKKMSFSDPEDVNIFIKGKHLERETQINIAKTDINMNFNNILAKELSAEENIINIIVEYKDDKGNVYKTQEQITINLENVTGWGKFKLFFVHLLRLY